MTYETDGQCDHINTSDCSRCLRTAMWLHLPSGLCYCHQHTSLISSATLQKEMPVIEQKIEPEWEPL